MLVTFITGLITTSNYRQDNLCDRIEIISNFEMLPFNPSPKAPIEIVNYLSVENSFYLSYYSSEIWTYWAGLQSCSGAILCISSGKMCRYLLSWILKKTKGVAIYELIKLNHGKYNRTYSMTNFKFNFVRYWKILDPSSLISIHPRKVNVINKWTDKLVSCREAELA